MAPARGLALLATLVIADSAWLYAACGILGFFAGQEGSPLPWAAVPALVAAGTLSARGIARHVAAKRQAIAVHAVLGAVVVYAVLAAGGIAARPAFDPGWLRALLGGELTVHEVAGFVIAMLMSAYLWRHGTALADTSTPHRRLLAGFHIGVVVFTLALLLEQASERDLHAGAMLAPFFFASLAGLAASRIPAGARVPSAWIRSVSACIVAVVGLGLALGATASMFGRSIVDLLYTAWDQLSGAIVWLVRSLLGTVAYAAAALIEWMQDAGIVEPGDGVTERGLDAEPGLRDLQPGGAIGDALAEFLQVAFLCVMVYALVRMLIFAYRQLPHQGEPPLPEEHEFIGAKADPLADIATLLRHVLPGRGTRTLPDLPGDFERLAPGVGAVFALYFELVSEAVLRGHEFVAARTPSERAPALAAALPGAPVGDITQRFNAACYGNRPTDDATLSALRCALEIAAGRRSARDAERSS